MHALIYLKRATAVFLVVLGFVWFGLLPTAQAVVPPPDGGYPNFTTAEGQNALQNLTTGAANTAVGWFSLFSNAAGSFNTALGAGTLLANTADQNTATGAGALLSNTTGSVNTADGTFALFSNTTGFQNTANGYRALYNNTTGNYNTAFGLGALESNTTADNNTALGINTLLFNTTGTENAACGANALLSNTIGYANTANGFDALYDNTTGVSNTASGDFALSNNTTGDGNTALGANAGINLTAGSGNVYIGAGMLGVASDSNACYIRSIFFQTSSGGTPVYINSAGKLGTDTSSRRFKEEIKPMGGASEALYALKPVTFRYKKAMDPQGIAQFGLVAEDVEEINPDLVVRDKEGKVYTVRYDAVNAMLLNEFLKEHKKVEEQQATIAELKSTVVQQQKGFESKLTKQEKQIEALSAGLQKVSAQLEASKPAPQVVNNP